MTLNRFLVCCSFLQFSTLSHAGPTIIQNGAWDLSENFNIVAANSSLREASVAFQLFNPNLGELKTVTYTRNSGVSNYSVYVSNNASTNGYTYGSVGITQYISENPNGLMLLEASFYGGMSGLLAPFQAPQLVSGGGIASEGSYTNVLTGTDMASFIGSGEFNLHPKMIVNVRDFYLSSGAAVDIQVNYARSFTLIYDYVPRELPEPTSLALLGIGFFGLLLNRRYGRRSSH